MKKLSLIAGVVLALAHSTFAQLSGYYEQSFEEAVFPPVGWAVQNVAGPTYTWASSTAQAFDPTHSAFIRYDAVAGGGQDWLITPQFTVAAGDSLSFYMRLAFAGYPPDSLIIRLSTTNNQVASFTTRLLRLAEGTNYPTNATTWVRYAVPLDAYAGQNVYLAFAHYNIDGDGLYVDKVAIGTKPPFDAKTNSIATPNSLVGQNSPVTAVVSNQGTSTATFDVTAEINPGGYTSTQTVTALAPNATSPVTFANWTPTVAGNYTLKVYTSLASDANHTNDTLTQTITAFDAFPQFGWSSETPFPAGRWAHGQAFSKPCVAGTDTAYLYVVGGADASFANTALCYRQNLSTGVWQPIADIPTTRTQVSAAEVKGKIYVPGGYGGSFTPVTTLSIYDPATNTWSTGAALPQATGDYAIGTYADSLLYVIGGYSGASDITNVQIYNVNTNTWTAGTAFAGTAVGGGRMGITGNTIVFAGGYSQTLAATLPQAWKGVIDPVNPTQITWTALPNIPVGTRGRLGAGAGLENGRVYFTGGDPNGGGTAVNVETFAYNTNTDLWEMGPNKITGVSNICNFTSVLANDSIYMVSVGGYNGVSVVAVNEWINIGPYAKPYAIGDTAFCGAAAVPLNAFNGTAYSWTPSALVDDPSSASPTTTSISNNTLFHVSITQRYGCNVTDSVMVTSNPLPNISGFTVDQETCNGEQNGEITVNVNAGTPGYNFDWDGTPNGDGTATITNLGAGTYTVTVTDASSCQATDTYVFSELPAIVASVNNVVVTGCTGTLSATVSGGTGNFVYLWNPSGQTTQTATNLCAGTYTVTVTDAEGCETTASGTVVNNAGINETNTNIHLSVYPNPFESVVFLKGNNISENEFTVYVKDAIGKTIRQQQVNIVNGEVNLSIDLNELAAGIYTVTAGTAQYQQSFKVIKK